MLESPAPAKAEAADPREMRAERRLAMLGLLTDIGMQLARDLSRRVGEAMQDGEPLDGGAVALEFSRLSRAVRQTIGLEARLDQDREALARMFEAERAARDQARAERIEGRRAAVQDAVEDAITKAGGGNRKTDALFDALEARMEDPREDDDFADLPMSELVGRICAALGVTVDWDLWKNTDWAAEEWRAALPDSPYAPMTAEAGAEPGAPSKAAPASAPPRRLSG